MHCKVTEKFFEVTRSLDEAKKRPVEYMSGISLYNAEVMFLHTIYHYPKENVSGISKLLGITKGAVTQSASKLLQKNLIEVVQKENNKKEKYYRLTNEGAEVLVEYMQKHDEANRKICEYFSSLTQEESKGIFDFLDQLENNIPFTEFICGCHCQDGEETAHKKTDTACSQF